MFLPTHHFQVVRIERVQIEMDTAKTSAADLDALQVDYNRAGCALLEIVTAPDMRSGAEAAAFVKKLQRILRHVGASDANMEASRPCVLLPVADL